MADATEGSDEGYLKLPARQISINQLIGFNIGYFRKSAGLTQEEVGRRLGGWTKVAVSAAERSWDGKRVRKFDADELSALAVVLGIPLIALFLPPPDTGITVRYLVDFPGQEEEGEIDLMVVLPRLLTGLEGRAQAYRDRLYMSGLTGYLEAETDQMIADARREADETLSRARREADDILSKSGTAARQVTGDARARAKSLEEDAQERWRLAVADLVKRREVLEQRVGDLQRFEREYRGRFINYFEGMIRDLKAAADDDFDQGG